MRHLPTSISVAEAPSSLHVLRVAVWLAVGAVLAWVSITAGVAPAAVIGVVVGAVAAVVTQRLQLARFAAGVRRSEGADWIDRVPTSLAALRRPLRAVEQQLSVRSAALEDATARDRLRDVAVDALELEVDTLDRALGDARADMAEILASLDRALAGAAPQAVLRRELVELRELVRLSVYAELPNDVVPLGDVVADVVSAGVPRGRVQVNGPLPSMTAPAPLIEAMVRSVIGHALSMGEHVVEIAGTIDGAMVVLEVAGPNRPEPTIHIALARRAVAILGGDVVEKRERTMVVVPARFVPGLRAVTPQPLDWDVPEAM
jgi:hypothetical protein